MTDTSQGDNIDRVHYLNERGGPAFPVSQEIGGGVVMNATGMTLRDFFAAMALQGINANPEVMQYVTMQAQPFEAYFGKMAEKAYAQADEMLKARRLKE